MSALTYADENLKQHKPCLLAKNKLLTKCFGSEGEKAF
jgi:hypothetical protein